MKHIEQLLHEEFSRPGATLPLESGPLLARARSIRRRRTVVTVGVVVPLVAMVGAAQAARLGGFGDRNWLSNAGDRNGATVRSVAFATPNDGFLYTAVCREFEKTTPPSGSETNPGGPPPSTSRGAPSPGGSPPSPSGGPAAADDAALDPTTTTARASAGPRSPAPACGRGKLYATNDGGRGWRNLPLASKIAATPIERIVVLSKSTVFVVSADSAWVTQDAGRSWAAAAMPAATLKTIPAGSVLGSPRPDKNEWGVNRFEVFTPQGLVGLAAGPPGVSVEDVQPQPDSDGGYWVSCASPGRDRLCVAVTKDNGKNWRISDVTAASGGRGAPDEPGSIELGAGAVGLGPRVNTANGRNVCVFPTLASGKGTKDPQTAQGTRVSALMKAPICSGDSGITWHKIDMLGAATTSLTALVNGDVLATVIDDGGSASGVRVMRIPAGGERAQPLSTAPKGIIALQRTGGMVIGITAAMSGGSAGRFFISTNGDRWTVVETP